MAKKQSLRVIPRSPLELGDQAELPHAGRAVCRETENLHRTQVLGRTHVPARTGVVVAVVDVVQFELEALVDRVQ